MSILVFSNNATTTLAGSITNVATTVNLAAGSGAEFPALAAGQFFKLTFTDAATGLLNEIVNVTAISGDTITMVRAQEGTTALAWSAGDIASNFWTAGSAAIMLQAGQLQAGTFTYAQDTGSANAYVATYSPAITALTAGLRLSFKAANQNTGASTLNVNGLGAVAINNMNGQPMASNQIGVNNIVEVVYQGGGWQLTSASTNSNQTFAGITTYPNGTSIDNNGKVTINTGVSLVIGTQNHLTFANSTVSVENPAGQAFQIENGTSSVSACGLARVENTNVQFWAFQYQGTLVGTITTSGSSTAYNTTSDETMKDFIGTYSTAEAVRVIRADPVRDFHWNDKSASPGSYAVGWGAQTSYSVSQDLATLGGWYIPAVYSEVVYDEEGVLVTPPTLVTPYQPCDEGTPGAAYHPWSVDQSKRTPYLWAATTWLLDEHDALRSRVDAQDTLIATMQGQIASLLAARGT